MSAQSASRREGVGDLRRIVHQVTSLSTGPETRYDDGNLSVSEEAARSLLADPSLAGVRVSCVSPAESARVVKLLDAVEPRTKGDGGGVMFPGLLGPARPGGAGETHVLRGAAVVAAGFLPRAQEAVVQMSGEGAELSPLAATHNVVVEFEPADGADWEAVELAVRLGTLRLAVHLAEAARDTPPDAVEELPAAQVDGEVPRVVAVTNLQTQGAFKDVFVYGRSMGGSLPTAIEPNELEDGAVVSGQYGHPALKNPTYLHQNHPVVRAVRQRLDVALGGVVIAPEPVEESEKRLVSEHAARLCRALGADGAVITKEGGGNADADTALKMDALEELGIPAVGLFAEMAGRDGTGPPVVVPPEKATAMVSTGNYDEPLALDAVERAVGGDSIDIVGAAATDAVELPTAAIYGSLNPLGWGRLTCAGNQA